MAATVGKIFRGVASACLGLLVLQTSISFLPDIVLFKYLTATRIVLIAGLGSLAVARVLGEGKQRGRVLRDSELPMLLLAVFMLVWFAASALWSLSPISASGFRLQAEEALAFILVILLVRDKESMDNTLLVFLIAASVAALFSIKQVVEAQNTNYFLVYKDGWKAVEAIEMPPGALVRPSGHFNNPNLLAAYLIMLIPVAASYIRKKVAASWMIWVTLAVSSIALVLTFSRGALIALLVAVAFVFLVRKKSLRWAGASALVLAVIANPFSTDRLSSALARLTAWSAALAMIAKRPLFGVGLGNFRRFAQSEASADLWHAHNLFLNTAAEAGIVAGILILAIVILAILWALRLAVKGNAWQRSIGMGLAVSFTAFLIASLVDDAYNYTPISYTFWLLLGMLVAGRRMSPRADSHSIVQALPIARKVLDRLGYAKKNKKPLQPAA